MAQSLKELPTEIYIGTSPEEVPDGLLVRRYLAGDIEAMGQLYRRYNHKIKGNLVNNGATPTDAEDLAHNVWTWVMTWPKLKPDGNLPGLLFRAARHLAMQHKRSADRLVKNTAIFGLSGGQLQTGNPSCRYCDSPAKERGMCSFHARRKDHGWPESRMREPARKYTRNKST